MKVTFLATEGWDPEYASDASGILVDRTLLIDTGYFAVNHLKRLGINPREIEHIYFTHLHHDHYMGLSQIIFWYLQTGKPLSKLNLYGPRADLTRVVRLTLDFLQAGDAHPFYHACGSPTLHELVSGDGFTVGDGDSELKIEVGDAFHAVDCLCARITDKSGRVLGVTGDTFYCESVVQTLKGCDLLVHETSLGASEVDFDHPPANRHSSVTAALRTAHEVGVNRMAVIHFPRRAAEAVLAKTADSGVDVFYPEQYKEYEV